MSAAETLPFQAETKQLLDIVIHSLYSNKEIFLRELLSNASDALDKLKLEALEQHSLLDADPLLEIEIVPDSQARTLTVSDSGIGMTRAEIVRLIGTIAKSGTRELVEQLKAGSSSDAAATLIGQFGVGFYSSFMVADRVEVVTRRAGADTATRWESTGDGSYTVSEASRFRRGTDVILHLKPVDPEHGLADYTSVQVLKSLVKKHSDFVAHPIKLKEVTDGVPRWTTINSMKPIWTRTRVRGRRGQLRGVLPASLARLARSAGPALAQGRRASWNTRRSSSCPRRPLSTSITVTRSTDSSSTCGAC